MIYFIIYLVTGLVSAILYGRRCYHDTHISIEEKVGKSAIAFVLWPLLLLLVVFAPVVKFLVSYKNPGPKDD